jgi:hypothetical protein
MGSFEWKVGSPEPAFSAEALRVFQFDPGTPLPFRDLLRMMPREERRGKRALLSETLQSQGNLTRDIPLVLPDGQVHIIHTEASPEFNENGQLVGYTGIVQDVPDWPAEPQPADRTHRARARRGTPHGPSGWPAGDRPGPLQGHQRHAGPWRWR